MGRANTIRFVYVAGVVLVGFSCAVCSILGIPDLLIRRPAYTCELKGDACYERIDYEGALKWYERGLAFEPERYFLLCGKAKALRELGRYEEAVEIFGRATELKPERWTAPYGKAKILSDLGRWEEAAESYGDALKSFDDEFPETRYRAYGGRIRALKELGRMDEALAAYDEALTHFPEDGFLRRGKARLLIKLGRYDDPSLGSLRRREAVALIMDAYKKDVDPIYNKYLGADAALAGKLSVRCEVATSGAVTACSVESSTLGNAAMEREVCRHIRAWRFPPGGEESCTVVYRFVFTAAGAD
jgi:TonB family protein